MTASLSRVIDLKKFKLPKKSFISPLTKKKVEEHLQSGVKILFFINRRGYVIPEDIREVIYDVLRHRIGLTYEAEAENVTTKDVISKIVNSVEVP